VLSDVEDAYNRDFMENAEILFLSDEALPCAPEDFLRRLRDRYRNRILVLGMGAQGAMLLERDREPVLIPAYTRGSVVNTVGAGDALFSAFIHYYTKGLPAKAALERAVVFAGIKIGFHGASEGFCGESEIEEVVNGGISTL
jgi:ribokinase